MAEVEDQGEMEYGQTQGQDRGQAECEMGQSQGQGQGIDQYLDMVQVRAQGDAPDRRMEEWKPKLKGGTA